MLLLHSANKAYNKLGQVTFLHLTLMVTWMANDVSHTTVTVVTLSKTINP